MAFTVEDFEDLVKLLGEHPEWQARLRPVILGEEVLQIPSRMDRVEAAIERLTERMDAFDQRMDAFERRMDAFSARLESLASDVQILTVAVNGLVTWSQATEGRLGNISGQLLEFTFEKNLGNWLRDWVRRPRKVVADDLEKLDVAVSDGRISEAEVVQVAWADAIVLAQDRESAREVILVIELSQTINPDDVERAAARAAVVRRAGYDGRSFVAGNRITDQAKALAEGTGTSVVLIRPT